MSTPAPPNPQHGGSFVRDAETGALECVARSLTEAERAALEPPPPPPPAPAPEPQE